MITWPWQKEEPAALSNDPSGRQWPTVQEALTSWSVPKALTETRIPLWHIVAAAPWGLPQEQTRREWRNLGVPINDLAQLASAGDGSYPYSGVFSPYLRLLTWEEARPLVLDWFTRAAVVAKKTQDPDALDLLHAIRVVQLPDCPSIVANAHWSMSHSCSVEGLWEVALILGRGFVQTLSNFGWDSAARILDERYISDLLSHATAEMWGAPRERMYDLAKQCAPTIRYKMNISVFGVLAAVYARPRVPPGGLERLRTHVERMQEGNRHAEEQLKEQQRDADRAQALLVEIERQFAESVAAVAAGSWGQRVAAPATNQPETPT